MPWRIPISIQSEEFQRPGLLQAVQRMRVIKDSHTHESRRLTACALPKQPFPNRVPFAGMDKSTLQMV
jgi:hypothetical protein